MSFWEVFWTVTLALMFGPLIIALGFQLIVFIASLLIVLIETLFNLGRNS